MSTAKELDGARAAYYKALAKYRTGRKTSDLGVLRLTRQKLAAVARNREKLSKEEHFLNAR